MMIAGACLRGCGDLPYKLAMAETTTFPRRLILAGAMITGVLLALAVHLLGQSFGLDLGGLWRNDPGNFMPIGSAVAWWLIAAMAFVGGYVTANLMHSAVSGRIPQRMRQFLVAIGVLVLAGAGHAALGLGGIIAFCGAHFALRKA
jgi:Na+/proline symporter